MSWPDQIRQRIFEFKERKIPIGRLTYDLHRGIEDQAWMLEMLEEARDLLAEAGSGAGGLAERARSWVDRLEKGPLIDATGATRAVP